MVHVYTYKIQEWCVACVHARTQVKRYKTHHSGTKSVQMLVHTYNELGRSAIRACLHTELTRLTKTIQACMRELNHIAGYKHAASHPTALDPIADYRYAASHLTTLIAVCTNLMLEAGAKGVGGQCAARLLEQVKTPLFILDAMTNEFQRQTEDLIEEQVKLGGKRSSALDSMTRLVLTNCTEHTMQRLCDILYGRDTPNLDGHDILDQELQTRAADLTPEQVVQAAEQPVQAEVKIIAPKNANTGSNAQLEVKLERERPVVVKRVKREDGAKPVKAEAEEEGVKLEDGEGSVPVPEPATPVRPVPEPATPVRRRQGNQKMQGSVEKSKKAKIAAEKRAEETVGRIEKRTRAAKAEAEAAEAEAAKTEAAKAEAAKAEAVTRRPPLNRAAKMKAAKERYTAGGFNALLESGDSDDENDAFASF